MTFQFPTGSLRLQASAAGMETVLSNVYRTAPYHPGPLHRRDGIAEVTLQGVGPGMFPGDRLAVEVRVDEGATLVVLGQGASKVYPAPLGQHAECRTDLTVGRNGALWWLPGELIPFRDAEMKALTSVRLDASAKFAHLEIVTTGRAAMGEHDRYRRLDLRLQIDVAGQPRLVERSLIDPRTRRPDTIGRHGTALSAGTLVLVGYPRPQSVPAGQPECWVGIDGDERLTIARGIARSAATLRTVLLALLRVAAHGSIATP